MSDVDGTAWTTPYATGTGAVAELALGAQGKFLRSGGAAAAPAWQNPYATVIQPASFSTTQNDYSPTGIGTADVVYLVATALAHITGIDSTGSVNGRPLRLVNNGVALILVDTSPLSTAGNLFTIPNGQTLYVATGAVVDLMYSTVTSSWLVLCPSPFVYLRQDGVNLVADVNDYDPSSDLSSGKTQYLRVNPSGADRSITGLVPIWFGLNLRGEIIAISNVSATFNLTLVNGSASSAVGNRFDLGADIVIGPKGGATLVYDGTSTIWRCIGKY